MPKYTKFEELPVWQEAARLYNRVLGPTQHARRPSAEPSRRSFRPPRLEPTCSSPRLSIWPLGYWLSAIGYLPAWAVSAFQGALDGGFNLGAGSVHGQELAVLTHECH